MLNSFLCKIMNNINSSMYGMKIISADIDNESVYGKMENIGSL